MTYPAVYGPLYSSSSSAGATILGSGYLVIPPAVSWVASNGAAVSTLAPFTPDPRGPFNVAPWYIPYSGNIERLPQQWDDLLRGYTEASLTDAWFSANLNPQPILITEILNDGPYAYWPCTDMAKATSASNLAPGNLNPLYVISSKYGTGAAVQAFAQNSGALLGAQQTLVVNSNFQLSNQAGMWGQSGVEVGGPFYLGYSLACTDGNFPDVAGGVTVETWFQVISPFPAVINPFVLGVATGASALFALVLDGPGGTGTGNLQLWGPGDAITTLSAANYLTGTPPITHVAVSFTNSAWTAYVDGSEAASGSWSLPGEFTYVSLNGNFNNLPLTAFGSSGAYQQCYNGYAGHLAIFPAILPPQRIQTHYLAGLTALAGEPSEWRIERLLQAGNATGRRCILQQNGPDITNVVSCQDIPGQPISASVSNIVQNLLPAMFFITPTGDMFHLSREYTWGQEAKWTLGEDQWAGEIPYELDITFDYDPSRIQNQIQLTQLDNQDIIVPAQAAMETASQQQYGTVSNLATGYLAGDATEPLNYGPGLYDEANWLANTYKAPVLRLSSVTVTAQADPSRWPFVLGASVGDIVQVNRRPPSSGNTVISVLGRITQTERTLRFSTSGVVAAVTCIIDPAPEANALTLDDPVRGLLNGDNVFGW